MKDGEEVTAKRWESRGGKADWDPHFQVQFLFSPKLSAKGKLYVGALWNVKDSTLRATCSEKKSASLGLSRRLAPMIKMTAAFSTHQAKDRRVCNSRKHCKNWRILLAGEMWFQIVKGSWGAVLWSMQCFTALDTTLKHLQNSLQWIKWLGYSWETSLHICLYCS